MLTVQLKTPKSLDLSKSSFTENEADIKKLKCLIEQQERTIRKLGFKVIKLEETLSRERLRRGNDKENRPDSNQNEELLCILKFQIQKSRQNEEVLSKLVATINQLVYEISLEEFIIENPQLRSSTRLIPSSKASNQQLTGHDIQHNSIHQSAFKQAFFLQSSIRLLTENYRTVTNLLLKERESSAAHKQQLQTERRHKMKLKRLLEKSQCQNNMLLLNIDELAVKQKDLSLKNRQEWVQFSKFLTFRIANLQNEKKEMHLQSMREKQSWNKKYGELLKTVKSLKQVKR